MTEEMQDAIFNMHVQNIKSSVNLDKYDILEVGNKHPYYRFPNFPIIMTSKEMEEIFQPCHPENPKKCNCDFVTVILRRGCQCGGS